MAARTRGRGVPTQSFSKNVKPQKKAFKRMRLDAKGPVTEEPGCPPATEARVVDDARGPGAGAPGADDEVGFVTDDDIEVHDNAVAKLDADIRKVVLAEGPSSKAASFQRESWVPYVKEWREWLAYHTGFFYRWSDGTFALQRARYGDLREQWLKSGKATDAPPNTETSPGNGVTSTIKEASSALMNVLVGGVVLYLVVSLAGNRKS
jgi:hypothetical protein